MKNYRKTKQEDGLQI